MDIGSFTGQPMTIDQANPLLYGMVKGGQAGADFANSIYHAQQANAKAMVAPQMAQQDLVQSLFNNKILGAAAGIAPQMAQANLTTAKANEFNQPGPGNLNQLHLMAQQGNPQVQAILSGMGGNGGGINFNNAPASISGALAPATQNAQMTATGNLNAQGNQQALQSANTEFNTATQAMNYLHAMQAEYKAAGDLVGPGANKLPIGLSPSLVSGYAAKYGLDPKQVAAAQAFDTNMNNFVGSVSNLTPVLGGHESNMILQNIISGKPTRALNNDAFSQISDEGQAAIQRALEEGRFKQNALADPSTNYNQANQSFAQYQADHPLVDPETGKVNHYQPMSSMSYLPGTNDSNNKSLPLSASQISKLKKMLPETNQSSSSRIRVMDKNGNPGTVSAANLNEALASGYRRI